LHAAIVAAVFLRNAPGRQLFGISVCLLYTTIGVGVIKLAALLSTMIGMAVTRNQMTGNDCERYGGATTDSSGLTEPLLPNNTEDFFENGPTGTNLVSEGLCATHERLEDESDDSTEANLLGERQEPPRSLPEVDLEAAKALAKLDHTISLWRNSIFIAAYVILTAISFLLGVEAVDLSNTNGSMVSGSDVAFIALAIASLQAGFFLTKRIVSHMQARPEIRLDLRAVHVHAVRFTIDRYDAYCDVCSEEVKDGECFRCKLCDFDYCMACFKKGKKLQDWGVLRGDSGPKVPERIRQASLQTYLMRALGLLKPYALYVLVTAFCLLFNVVCRLLVPHIEGGLFDDLITSNADSFFRRVRILAAFWIGQTFFQSIQRFVSRIVSRRLRLDLRMKLFNRLLSQDIAFFDATRAGAMARRVDGDVEDMSRPVPILVNTVLQSTVIMIGALVCCLVSSARLTVLSAACLGPIAYLTRVSAEWGSGLQGQMIACEEEGNAAITEAMTNIRNIRALSAEQYEAKRYERVLSKLLKKMHRDALGDIVIENLEGILEFLVEFLVLVFGGMAIVDEHEDALSVGQLIAFTMYWEMLREGVGEIQDVFSDLAQASGAAQRVFDLLDIHPDIPLDQGIEIERNTFRGRLCFEDVHFAYQARPEKKVLNGFSLDIPAGGTCALVGRSGAGKTSLVHLLLRFYDPQSGRITIDGVPLTDLDLRSFHNVIGFVSQDTKLSYGSVRENLIYGLPWVPEDGEVEAAARAANCAEFIEEMEEGYDTNLGEAGVRLSGGQRQRLAIARAFLRRPRLLLLDEATSHLDTENEQLVQEGIDRLVDSASEPSIESGLDYVHPRGRCTVVIVAHRLSTVRNADVIAVVCEGRVAEKGSHDELLTLGGIYAKLIAKQGKRASDILAAGHTGQAKDVVNTCNVDILFEKALGKLEESSRNRSSSNDSSSSSSDSG
jgi:ATP-binding cassette subfamily B protein